MGLLFIAGCRKEQPTASSTPTVPIPAFVFRTRTPIASYPGPSVSTRTYPTFYARPPTYAATKIRPYPIKSTPTPSRIPRFPRSPTATLLPAYPVFVPAVMHPPATPTPTPTATPSPIPTPTPTIDFGAVRSQLEAEGQDLRFAKIGFHTGVGGNRNGLGRWMKSLDMAGVPFFLKSVDDAGPLLEAQQLVEASGVPHTLIYRRSGNKYDTPDYSKPPEESARDHWQIHVEAFPKELDKNLIWIETLNEVDKGRAEWLGRFALETARLAEADGFIWAAFGWASGEPEITDWQTPSMLSFLELAGANPDRLAIALHEYSYIDEDIADEYPFKVGRFQHLYQLTDQLDIERPTVLITEWGWEYQSIPSIGKALDDIAWAASLYAPYPELKGAAIWYLGGGFGNIAEETQPLIIPLMHQSLGTYFAIPMDPETAPINPEEYRPYNN